MAHETSHIFSLFFLTLPLQRLPRQRNFEGYCVSRASGCGALASVSLLCAAGHGSDPGGAVCFSGDKRPAGSSVRGLLWRGQYLLCYEFLLS